VQNVYRLERDGLRLTYLRATYASPPFQHSAHAFQLTQDASTCDAAKPLARHYPHYTRTYLRYCLTCRW